MALTGHKPLLFCFWRCGRFAQSEDGAFSARRQTFWSNFCLSAIHLPRISSFLDANSNPKPLVKSEISVSICASLAFLGRQTKERECKIAEQSRTLLRILLWHSNQPFSLHPRQRSTRGGNAVTSAYIDGGRVSYASGLQHALDYSGTPPHPPVSITSVPGGPQVVSAHHTGEVVGPEGTAPNENAI